MEKPNEQRPSTKIQWHPAVSLFRASAPKELLNQISKEGYIIERQSPGIYYVNGLSVPTQIVVTNELNSKNHESLKVLSKSAQTDDIQRFTELASAFTEPGDKEKADAVLQVSVAANRKNYDKVRRTSDMCEALRELMKEEIEEELKKNHLFSVFPFMMVGINHAAFSVLQEVSHAFQCLVSQFQSRSFGVEQDIRCVCLFSNHLHCLRTG